VDESSPFSQSKDKVIVHGSEFLKRILKVVKHSKLYSFEHPFIESGLEEMMKILSDTFLYVSDFFVDIVRGELLIEGIPAEVSEKTRKDLAKLFKRAQIKSVRFISKLAKAELLEFVKMFAMKPDEMKAAGGPEKILAQKAENIRINIRDSTHPDTGTVGFGAEEKDELLNIEKQESVLRTYLVRKLKEKKPKKQVIDDFQDDAGDETRQMQRMLNPTETHPELLASTVSEAVREKLGAKGVSDRAATREATLESLERIARMFTHESTSWLSSKDLLVKVIMLLDPELRKTVMDEDDTGDAGADILVDQFSLDVRIELLVRELAAGRLPGDQLRKALDNLARSKDDMEELIRRVHDAIEKGKFESGTRTLILENLDSISAIARGEEEKGTIAPMRPPKKLYVADRDEEVCRKISELVSKSGHVVSATDSGETLINQIMEAKPNLIIMDVKLEDKSGLEILERLVRSGIDSIPVMIYSEMEKPASDPIVQQYPFLEWITKDIPVDEFAGQVKLYLNIPNIWLMMVSDRHRAALADALAAESNVIVDEFYSLFDLIYDLSRGSPDCIVVSASDTGGKLVEFVSFLRHKPAHEKTPVFLVDADRTESSLRSLLSVKHLRFVPGGLRTGDVASRIIEFLGRSQSEYKLL
jgi:CheY-like chemotaxis protein